MITETKQIYLLVEIPVESSNSERRVSQEVLRNKYRYSSRGHLDDDHFDIQLT